MAKRAHGIWGTPWKEGHSEGLGEKSASYGMRKDSQAKLLDSMEKIRARAGRRTETQSQRGQNEELRVHEACKGSQAGPVI